MTGDSPLKALARAKLERVFGPHRAEELIAATIAEAELAGLDTPDELYRFGRTLEKRGGFEGAVGAILSVQAVLRGAKR